MIYGKYGEMILENLEKNYPYRKIDLEATGELEVKLFQREKEILELKEKFKNEITNIYPYPDSKEIYVISKYHNFIEALLEDKLMPYILEKI